MSDTSTGEAAVGALPSGLTKELFEAIHSENLARYAANAAEPYSHAVYAAHEARLGRLVAVLADGDELLAQKFGEALFDITHDGLPWLVKVFAKIRCELRESERESERAIWFSAYRKAIAIGHRALATTVAQEANKRGFHLS